MQLEREAVSELITNLVLPLTLTNYNNSTDDEMPEWRPTVARATLSPCCGAL